MLAFNLHYADGRTVNIVSLNRNGNGETTSDAVVGMEQSLSLMRNSQCKVTVTKQ